MWNFIERFNGDANQTTELECWMQVSCTQNASMTGICSARARRACCTMRFSICTSKATGFSSIHSIILSWLSYSVSTLNSSLRSIVGNVVPVFLFSLLFEMIAEMILFSDRSGDLGIWSHSKMSELKYADFAVLLHKDQDGMKIQFCNHRAVAGLRCVFTLVVFW